MLKCSFWLHKIPKTNIALTLNGNNVDGIKYHNKNCNNVEIHKQRLKSANIYNIPMVFTNIKLNPFSKT